MVADQVLAFEFDRDLGADILQLVNGPRKERPPTSDPNQVFNDGAAGRALDEYRIHWIDNAYRKDLNVLFPGQTLSDLRTYNGYSYLPHR